MDMDEPIESEHNKAMLAEFERRRRARTLTLPTDDVQVRHPSQATVEFHERLVIPYLIPYRT